MKNIILIGGGGHALSCIDVLSELNKFRLVGYLDNFKKPSINLKYLGSDKELNKLRKDYKYAIIGVGQIKDYKIRLSIYRKLKKLEFIIPNIISKKTYISKNHKIDEGNTFFRGVIINSHCSIGSNNIFNNNSLIEHNVIIGSNNHISTGSIINGNAKIGNNNFIGSGVIINNNIKIGNNCIISSGSVIKKNISNNKFVK